MSNVRDIRDERDDVKKENGGISGASEQGDLVLFGLLDVHAPLGSFHLCLVFCNPFIS